MKRLYQLLIATFIFLIPSNLFYVLTESGARLHGLRVDYLLPKFWAIDLVIWAVIVLWLIEEIQNNFKTFKKWQKSLVKQPKQLLIFASVLLTVITVREFTAEHNLIAVWTLLSWIKLGLLAAVLHQKRQLLATSFTYSTLAITVLFQSLVGFWQFFTQQSVAGYLFLGETDLSSFAGLSKTSWGGVERVLPYGTTAHPNVLGGFLTLSLLLLIPFWKSRKDPFVKAAIGLCMATGFGTLLLTQSMSAWLAFAIGVAVVIWKPFFTKLPKWLLPVGIAGTFVLSIWLPLAGDSLSVTRRQYLNQAAIRMTIDHPFIGVGLQNFTTQVENYSPTREVVRFVQPAHNAALIFFAETGLLGLTLGFILWKLAKKPQPGLLLLALVPIAFLDHYLITMQSGTALLIFYTLCIKK